MDADPVRATSWASLIAEIHAAEARCGTVRVVAIDGGAAAGKSTLAAELQLRLNSGLDAGLDAALTNGRPTPMNAAILHTDDLLDGWADPFGFWTTFRADVLAPLAAGRPGRYRRYDWTRGEFAELVPVPLAAVLVVEGVSSIAACGPALALGVILTVGRAERERRWRERDGELSAPELSWLAAEAPYLAQLTELSSITRLPDSSGLSLLRRPVRFPAPGQPAESRPPAGSRDQ